MYSAINLEACEDYFKALKSKCAAYPGAIKVWENNFDHVIQLINYPQDVRRIMYTTNAIESVNSSLRKVTKNGMFENETAVFKVFYLRIKELDKKWCSVSLRNWALVLNQLACMESISNRVRDYLN